MKKAVLFILCFVSVGALSMGAQAQSNTSNSATKSAATSLHAPASVDAENTTDIADRLKGLYQLKEEGLITEDEYKNKKSALLGALDQKMSVHVQETKPEPTENVESTQPVSSPPQHVAPVTIPDAQEYNPLTSKIVPSASFGMGLGKYGTLGIELNMRPSDRIGFSLGLGGQYYQAEWRETHYRTEYYYTTRYSYYGYPTRVRNSRRTSYTTVEEDSGFAAMGGAKLHLYFTDRDRPSQHNIFLAGYFGDAIGPAAGLAYGFERHSKRGLGFDVSIGLAFAPDAEEYMAEMLGTSESNMDYTWVPLLFELGMIF